jgi:hypothetical protein
MKIINILESATAGATSTGAVATATAAVGKIQRRKKPGKNALDSNKLFAENFDAEYDDEAGMSHNSLYTIMRAAEGLLGTIKEGDNLPEWCQEKLSIAEDYLITVWDYLQSETDIKQGVEENIKGVRAPKRTAKSRNPIAKNATAAIGGGGAGAHKDKKKALKQGKVKHNTSTYENALHQALAQSLQIMEGRKGPEQRRK